MVPGTLLLYYIYSCVFFILELCIPLFLEQIVQKHALLSVDMEHDLCDDTPNANALVVHRVCVNCPMVIDGHELLTNFHS